MFLEEKHQVITIQRKNTAFWAIIIDGHHAKYFPNIYLMLIFLLLSYALIFQLYKCKQNKQMHTKFLSSLSKATDLA